MGTLSKEQPLWRKACALVMAVVLAVGLAPMPRNAAYADQPDGGLAAGQVTGMSLATQDVPAALDYTKDEIAFIKADGGAFGMFAAQEGTSIVNNDGKLEIVYVPKNTTTYVNGVYLNASISDSSTRDEENHIAFADGKLTFSLDTSYCGKAWPVVPVKDNDGTTKDQYYLAIPPLDKIQNNIELSVTSEEAMWKVVKATLEDHPGAQQDYLAIYLNSGTPTHQFFGTQKEAAESESSRESDVRWGAKGTATITSTYTDNTGKPVTVNNEEKYVYRFGVTIPATQQFTLPIVSVSSDSYAARRADVNLQSKTATFGNYNGSATLAVSSSVADVKVGEQGSVTYKGYLLPYFGAKEVTGTSNEWDSTLNLSFADGVYDQLYAVCTPELEGTDPEIASVGVNGSASLVVKNTRVNKKAYNEFDGNDVKLKMHVSADAPYAEAGTWVDRTMNISFADVNSAAVTFSGDALTGPASEFAYEGEAVDFIKFDGSGFGMYAPQEGTTIALNGDNVEITYVPKTTSTYVGFYLGGDNKFPGLWNAYSYNSLDGKAFTLSLPASVYCGHAWPVAIVKSDKTTTPTSQYYLAIPARDRILDADYAAVEKAKEGVPANLSIYTDSSVKAVTDAVAAVAEGKKAYRQAEVDAMAKAIDAAVAALVEKDADYSAVNAAKAKVPADLSAYTAASAKAVTDAVAAAVAGKKITEQAAVDAMAEAIDAAVDKLAKKGDAVITAADVSKTYGDAAFALGAKLAKGDGTLKYASSNPKVATVAANGTVTITGAGEATITVSADATGNFNAASKAVKVTVAQASQVLSAKKAVSKTFGDKAFALGAKLTKGDGTLTYRSSNSKVATVSKAGKVTVKGAGTAKITVSAAKTANYKAAFATVTVTVAKAKQAISAKASVKPAKALKANKKTKKLAKNATIDVKKLAKVSAKTTVKYAKVGKTGGKSISVNAKTGKITVKKGLKAGTYTVKVKLTAAANANYKAAKAKTIQVKITVKK